MNNKLTIYISYCNEGEELDLNFNEWIDKYSTYLVHVFEKLVGFKPEIYSSNAKKSIKLDTVNAFIILSTHKYFEKKDCQEEYKNIINQKNENTYSIKLMPIENEVFPKSYFNLKYYKYYNLAENSSDYTIFNSKDDFLYWFHLIDMSYDIYHTLPADIISDKTFVKKEKGTVYLAEASDDQKLKRDLLKKELQLQGFKVLPDKPLSSDISKLKDEINEYLKRSIISIHIFGNYKGRTVDDISIVELQNQIGSDCIKSESSTNNLLFRLIWLPPNLEVIDDDHHNYIEQLKRDKNLLVRAEVIQTPLEEFKNVIQYKISDLKNIQKSKSVIDSNENAKLLYLIYDKEDEKQCVGIYKLLKDKGFNIIKTSYSDEEIKNIEDHRTNLIHSDIVLIYYGNKNTQWINTKLKEVVKIPGYGRIKPFLAKAIITKNKLPEMNGIFYKDFEIIEENGSIDFHKLKPFFDKIGKLNG